MPRLGMVTVCALLAGACTSATSAPGRPGAVGTPGGVRASDYRGAELRQPALFVRVTFGPGDLPPREREELVARYESALLEAFNARGILVRDVRSTAPREAAVTPAAAAARAREVAADHAVLVQARVSRRPDVFCRDTRRAVQATATAWAQGVTVVRASDGAARLTIEPDATRPVRDFEPDCENPRDSRRRSPAETLTQAAENVVRRVSE